MRAEDYEYRARAKDFRFDQMMQEGLSNCCFERLELAKRECPALLNPKDPFACSVVALAARSGRKPAA